MPQICRWPGRIGPAVTDQVCITMDLTATCLAAAGVAPAADYPLDGVDLLPVLTGQAAQNERTLFWRMGNRRQRAVRRGDWKYLKVAEREFLFDLAYDPRERGNLVEEATGSCSPNCGHCGKTGTVTCFRYRRRDHADVEFGRHALVVLDSLFCYCGQ